jgi:hypothetical protein
MKLEELANKSYIASIANGKLSLIEGKSDSHNISFYSYLSYYSIILQLMKGESYIWIQFDTRDSQIYFHYFDHNITVNTVPNSLNKARELYIKDSNLELLVIKMVHISTKMLTLISTKSHLLIKEIEKVNFFYC